MLNCRSQYFEKVYHEYHDNPEQMISLLYEYHFLYVIGLSFVRSNYDFYLFALMAHPDRRISFIDMYCLKNSYDAERYVPGIKSDFERISKLASENRVEFCDNRTIQEVKRRMNELTKWIGEGCKVWSKVQLKKFKNELGELRNYLLSCKGIRNRPNAFLTMNQKARRTITRNIENSLTRITSKNKAVGDFLRSIIHFDYEYVSIQ